MVDWRVRSQSLIVTAFVRGERQRYADMCMDRTGHRGREGRRTDTERDVG